MPLIQPAKDEKDRAESVTADPGSIREKRILSPAKAGQDQRHVEAAASCVKPRYVEPHRPEIRRLPSHDLSERATRLRRTGVRISGRSPGPFLGVAWFNARSSSFDVPLILPALGGAGTQYHFSHGWNLDPPVTDSARSFSSWPWINGHVVARPTMIRLVAMFFATSRACHACTSLLPHSGAPSGAFAVCVLRRQTKWRLRFV